METNSKNLDSHDGTDCAGMKWTDIKQFQHRYLVDIPLNVEKHLQVELELPSPTFDPVQVTDYSGYKELFKPKPKLDTRLAYYKKLYARTNKSLLKELVKKHEYTQLPQYVVDVAYGAFEDNEDHAWCYTGGTLDCLSFNDDTYIAKAGLHQPVIQVADLYEPSISVCIELKEDTPVYSLKSASYDEEAFLAVRQKCKLSLFRLSHDTCLNAELAWKIKTNSTFVDMSFNNFKRNQIAAVNDSHNLKVKDFVKNKSIVKYNFATKDGIGLGDHFAQIMYTESNVIAFINRCCFYLLDLRSLNIQKSCLKTSWLKCDDLCTFSNTSKDANCIYISSIHNVAKFDIRLLKCVNKVMHMLSSPPFISSCITDNHGEYVCLSGPYIHDKVLLYSSSDSLSTPKYVPNTKDSLTATSLMKRLHICNLDERLMLPTLGMKLWKHNASDDINLYTLNSVGDVFKQKFLQIKPDHVDRLAKWGNIMSDKPKLMDATNVYSAGNIMHNISACFSEAKILTTLMKENHSQEEFAKGFCGLKKYLEGSVGESMNSIWDVEKIVTESNVNVTSEISLKSKVSEWLASTGGS